jgi:hypothetical protein
MCAEAVVRALRGVVSLLLVFIALPASAGVASLDLNPSTIVGGSGDSAVATVTLDAPAPAGGLTLDLTSSITALAASTPSLVVPAGATSATFVVGTNSEYRPFSGRAFDVTISARSGADGTTASALLHVTAQPIPGPFTGGTHSADQQARDGNICGGAFGSGNADAGGVLFRCDFPAGGGFSICRFLEECVFGCQETVNTITIGSPLTVADTCRSGPVPLTFDPQLVVGGGTSNGTLHIGAPATQFAEAQVSSNPPMVSPLGNFPIPEGATTAPFTVSTREVAIPTFLPLHMMLWQDSRFRFAADFVTIVPAPGAPAPAGPLAVFSLSLRPETVVGGISAFVVATVSLTGNAPSGGAVVTLSSSDPAVATLPASVTVPAGRSNAAVAVTAFRVTTPTPVELTATYGGVSRSATLTVVPIPPPVNLVTIQLDPAGVAGGGSSTGTVVIDPPAPAGGTSVPLKSTHALASVPASVTVPEGATRATFPIATSPVTASTVVTISGTLNFSTEQAFLTVTPNAPTLSVAGLSVSPTSLVGGGAGIGNTSVGTVTLTGPAPSAGVNVNLARDSRSVSVPDWILVPAGATSATFTIGTFAVTSSTTVTVSAAYGATTRTATLTVEPSPIASLTVSPSTVIGGESSTGTVTLTAPAPSGGSVVTLSDVGEVTTIPESVTVPAGATTATFPIATQPVTFRFHANIYARLSGVEKQALLIVEPGATSPTASITAVSVNPSSVVGGSSSQGTVTLTSGAPSGGMSVALTSSSSAASVPASLIVPAGATSASFTISTSGVTSTTSAVIGATSNGTSRTATLTVTPSTTSGNVTSAPSLSSPANRATVSQPVTFDWSNVTNAATYELQIDSSSTFSAPLTRSEIVSVSQATISGLPAQQLFWRVRGVSASGQRGPFSSSRRITVSSGTSAVTLSSLAVSPTSVVGGSGAQGTVTLSAAAPSGGAAVTLGDSSAAVTVPASVTVPAGATSATFAVTTSAVTASTSVTLTGSFGGTTRTATLTVTAATQPSAVTLSALAVSPTSLVGGTGAQGTVTLGAAAPSGGAVVSLSDSSSAATVPASVTVPAGATSATFAVTTSAVTASTSVTVTASFGGASRTATLTVTPQTTSPPPGGTVTLTVTATGRSGERLQSSPSGISVPVGSTGSASFPAGSTITLSVSNGRDAIWSGTCSSGGDKERTCAFRIDANASVTGNVQ